MQDFEEKLKGNYDVIIVGQAPVKDFPPEIIEALLAKVKAGAGIIRFGRFLPKTDPRGVYDQLTVGLLGIKPVKLKPPAAKPSASKPSAAKSPASKPSSPKARPPQRRDVQEVEEPVTTSIEQLAAVLNGVPLQKVAGFGNPKEYKKHLPEAITLRTCGNGRVAIVRYDDSSYWGLMTAFDRVDLDYEYQMSLVAKCILWAGAASRRPGLSACPSN